jgi:hypothetical protein
MIGALAGLAAIGAALKLRSRTSFADLGDDDFAHRQNVTIAINTMKDFLKKSTQGNCKNKFRSICRAQGALAVAMTNQGAMSDTGLKFATEQPVQDAKKLFRDGREAFITSGCLALSR